jgi:hypothetical protein
MWFYHHIVSMALCGHLQGGNTQDRKLKDVTTIAVKKPIQDIKWQ